MELIFAVLVFACLIPRGTTDSQGDALYALKLSLKASSDQLTDWYPDLVNPCAWSNVKCDPNNNVISLLLPSMGFSGMLSPQIGQLKNLTTLSLQGNSITGKIPEEIGNLSSLENLELENNHLSGVMPSSLVDLKNLKYLKLSHNSLSGTIPESLSDLNNLISLDLSSNELSGKVPEQLFRISTYNFTGNKLNCGGSHGHLCTSDGRNTVSSKKTQTGLIAGVVAGFASMLPIGLLFLVCKIRYKGYNHEVFFDVPGEVDRDFELGQLKRFLFRELQIATNNFSEENVLGQGGYGKVYKGVLADKTEVAVKRLTDYKKPGGDATFQREIEMISIAVHRNLLRLIGFCTTPTERLLVYPFMKNLSVAYHLREMKHGEPVLDWPARKRIALGTAHALEYLHEHCNPKIIHRDVKAANVLLDENFEAVVGDFGLAKLVDVKKTNVTTQVRGTMGHIAPEYLSTGKTSERTDVFGYGIMLLELVTGQRPIDLEGMDEVLLVDQVRKMERDKKLVDIVDRKLNKYDMGEVEKMIQVALLCTQQQPEQRPKMLEVVPLLEGEGLAERWKECQLEEIARKQEQHCRLQRRFDLGEDSTGNQEAIQLSGGR